MTFLPKERKGFTLIELMLVVIIIGILVAMVVPRLAGRSEQARRAAAKADIEANIALALDLYELDVGYYPKSLNDLITKPTPEPKGWSGPYLKKKVILDPWRNPYIYQSPGEHNSDYDLYSIGPNKTNENGAGDDIANWQEQEAGAS